MERLVSMGYALVAMGLLCERLLKWWLVIRFFQRSVPALTTPPRISILQPILSGDPTMAACLDHNVRHASPQVEFHWLVDEQDLPGQAICRALMVRHPQVSIHLRLLPPAPQGHNPKMFKLIAALPAAAGDLIVVLDDDTMLPTDGVASALPSLDLPGAGLVFGLPYQVDFSNLWSRLIAYFVNSNSLLTYLPYLALSEPFTINGMFYLLRRNTLDALGGFTGLERTLADDFAVAQWVRQGGYRLVQSPLCHAVSNHVAGPAAYWRLITRWLTFPRESLLRHLSWREVALLYGNTLIPTFAPLVLLGLAVGQQRWLPALIGGGYLLLNWVLFLVLDRRYLGGRSPLRWSWLVPVTQLLLPVQLLVIMLLPQRINWRGHVMQVERGGGFRFVRRR